jgi:hypothetical protein
VEGSRSATYSWTTREGYFKLTKLSNIKYSEKSTHFLENAIYQAIKDMAKSNSIANLIFKEMYEKDETEKVMLN